MQNPVRFSIDRYPDRVSMKVSLTPDAIGLRARYRALIVHLHNVPEPIFWDLGRELELERQVDCLGAPQRVCITCYGVESDNSLRLVFRNWSRPGDGFPLPEG
ncbi:MAG: hypothetical protein AMXMBFR33_60380 [Candidatus Xenobia bacterium]|jgi:hypothetical protein